jgi:two-component system OmpR family response regulator
MYSGYLYENPAMPKQTKVVFVIEDEPLQAEMLKDLINSKFKLEVHCFGTGEEAMKNWHLEPTVIVLDHDLNTVDKNAMNGVEVLKKIKSQSPLTQVVMLSGQHSLDVAANAIKYGAFDYIVKGEGALDRIGSIFQNIDDMMDAIYFRDFYKKMNTVLSIVLIVILVTIMALFANGNLVLNF